MRGILRQVYELTAVFAIMNLGGLAGVVAYLGVTGKLSVPRIRQIGDILAGRQDEATKEADASTPAPGPAAVAADAGNTASGGPEAFRTAVDQSREAVTDREIALRERNRFEAEIAQRLALSNSIMLQITTKLDALHSEKEAFEKQKQQEAGLRDEEGFKKELEVFNSLKPAQAFDYLIRKDVAEAARLLIEMDARTVGKILETARTPDQKKKADEILVKIREVAPARAAEVESGT